MHSALALVQQNIRVESHLIDDLLYLTRIARGNLEFARDSVDLHELIRGAVEISEPDLVAKQQHFELHLNAARSRTQSDGKRLKQVVWNLLKTPPSSPPKAGESNCKRVVKGTPS